MVDVRWEGKSGRHYTYSVYTREDELPGGPGNYIYAAEHSPGNWQPIFVGEAEQIRRDMLDEHPKRDCIIMNGATHIHVRANSGSREDRRAEAADIINCWPSVCN